MATPPPEAFLFPCCAGCLTCRFQGTLSWTLSTSQCAPQSMHWWHWRQSSTPTAMCSLLSTRSSCWLGWWWVQKTEYRIFMNNRNLPYDYIKDTSKVTHSIIVHEYKYTSNTEYFILESGGHTHIHCISIFCVASTFSILKMLTLLLVPVYVGLF